jgi:hypothetical protein
MRNAALLSLTTVVFSFLRLCSGLLYILTAQILTPLLALLSSQTKLSPRSIPGPHLSSTLTPASPKSLTPHSMVLPSMPISVYSDICFYLPNMHFHLDILLKSKGQTVPKP